MKSRATFHPIFLHRAHIATLIVITFLLLTISRALSQHITGSYTTSTPEASLFFLNPGYINPALGSGVIGMQANPAGLRSVSKRQFTTALAAPQSSTSRFTFQFIDSSYVYLPFDVQADIEMKEVGGLSAIGYAQQHGPWTWGVSMLQPRHAGITLSGGGLLDVDTQFQLDQPITKEMVPDLPVDEIPVTWDIDSKVKLGLHSKPAELYLSILPIEAAVSIERGPFALGAGLTYYHLSSSDEVGYITTSVQGNATISGTPTGVNPTTGQPWLGSIGADITIYDEPITSMYQFKLRGHRFAVSFGGVMNWGILSLGASYSHGFKATVTGSYEITSIFTTGLPDQSTLSDVQLELNQTPVLSGTAKMNLQNFAKDTLRYSNSHVANMGGYNAFSLGLSFLGIGAFAGAEVPQLTPDIISTYLGAYIDWPLPWLPFRINFGGIYRADSFMADESTVAPMRITTHIGGGFAMKLPFNKWFGQEGQPGWLRFGVRSSLTSIAVDVIQQQTVAPEERSLPNAIESLAMSIGVEIPF